MYLPLTFNLMRTSRHRWILEADGKCTALSGSEARILSLIYEQPNLKSTVVTSLINSKSDRSVRNLINRMRKKFVRTFGDVLIPLTDGKGYRVVARVKVNYKLDADARRSIGGDSR